MTTFVAVGTKHGDRSTSALSQPRNRSTTGILCSTGPSVNDRSHTPVFPPLACRSVDVAAEAVSGPQYACSRSTAVPWCHVWLMSRSPRATSPPTNVSAEGPRRGLFTGMGWGSLNPWPWHLRPLPRVVRGHTAATSRPPTLGVITRRAHSCLDGPLVKSEVNLHWRSYIEWLCVVCVTCRTAMLWLCRFKLRWLCFTLFCCNPYKTNSFWVGFKLIFLITSIKWSYNIYFTSIFLFDFLSFLCIYKNFIVISHLNETTFAIFLEN